ncbi:zinc ribbon domain-containing protein [Candidatus Sumerlaeota bacterium]|nr:zinc ribbon domain-containing protein [Candidatus Sumerlaeota bacterium]
MPVYEYEHLTETDCKAGFRFELVQPIKDDALKNCPECGAPVQRLISRTFVSTPTGDSQLKNMGFTKLVRRDEGVYENVTKTDKDAHRYMERGKPETIPNLKGKITD